MPSLVQLGEKELQELCKQVKETIAIEVKPSIKESTSFNIGDLWSVQQKMKTARGRWNSRNRTFYVRG